MRWRPYWSEPAKIRKSSGSFLVGRFEPVTDAIDLMSGKLDYQDEKQRRFCQRMCFIAIGISIPGIFDAFSARSLPLYFPVS